MNLVFKLQQFKYHQIRSQKRVAMWFLFAKLNIDVLILSSFNSISYHFKSHFNLTLFLCLNNELVNSVLK